MIARKFLLAATLSLVALGMGACVGKAPGYGPVGIGKAPPPAQAPLVVKG